jgi:hypothetical protein
MAEYSGPPGEHAPPTVFSWNSPNLVAWNNSMSMVLQLHKHPRVARNVVMICLSRMPHMNYFHPTYPCGLTRRLVEPLDTSLRGSHAPSVGCRSIVVHRLDVLLLLCDEFHFFNASCQCYIALLSRICLPVMVKLSHYFHPLPSSQKLCAEH